MVYEICFGTGIFAQHLSLITPVKGGIFSAALLKDEMCLILPQGARE